MREEILKKAEELGKLIAQSEEVKNANAVKEIYDTDKKVQKAILEYNIQNKALAEEFKKETQDEDLKNAIKARIGSLYNDITTSQTYLDYTAAEEKIAQLMKIVNDEINFQVTGERPSDCTGNCSSCGGCH